MKLRLMLITGILLATISFAEDEFSGYSLKEATEFRQQWTMANWDKGGPLMRYVFLNMSEFWNHSVIDRGGPVRSLPDALRSDVAEFVTTTDDGKMSLSDYVNNSTVNGALVVHHGQVVFESYPRMLAEDKHNYMSVSKPFASTLVAILEDRELVDVSKPIERYLPQMAGTGWEGIRVIDILDMASGIGCLEGEEGSYTNPETCYYHFEASLGWVPSVRVYVAQYLRPRLACRGNHRQDLYRPSVRRNLAEDGRCIRRHNHGTTTRCADRSRWDQFNLARHGALRSPVHARCAKDDGSADFRFLSSEDPDRRPARDFQRRPRARSAKNRWRAG
jgi:hypothetical protein